VSALPGLRRAYAGIGSRALPPGVGELIQAVSARLAPAGWVLRTGGSPGADQAFYRGARSAHGPIELYLPWPGFEASARDAHEGGHVWELARPVPEAYGVAARFYRGWDGRSWEELSEGERALLARDSHQVLGADLASPAGLVVCWTPDAGLDGSDARSEGTGQALRIAVHHGVPVLNLARPEHARRARGLCAPA
jgi:hypothetical protein